MNEIEIYRVKRGMKNNEKKKQKWPVMWVVEESFEEIRT